MIPHNFKPFNKNATKRMGDKNTNKRKFDWTFEGIESKRQLLQEFQVDLPATPILKWVGGKTQILHEVIKLYPKTMENYYEPFLGGGSTLLALLQKKKDGLIKVNGSIYASDVNQVLISLWVNV